MTVLTTRTPKQIAATVAEMRSMVERWGVLYEQHTLDCKPWMDRRYKLLSRKRLTKAEQAELLALNDQARELPYRDIGDSLTDQRLLKAVEAVEKSMSKRKSIYKTDEDVIAEVEKVAIILLRRAGFECMMAGNQPIHQSQSTRAQRTWETAVEIYELITKSCVQSALDNLGPAGPRL